MTRSRGSSRSQELGEWGAACLALSLLILAPAGLGAQERAPQPLQSARAPQDTTGPAQASDSLASAAADSSACIAANAFVQQLVADSIKARRQRGEAPLAPGATGQLPDSIRTRFKTGMTQCQIHITVQGAFTVQGAPAGP